MCLQVCISVFGLVCHYRRFAASGAVTAEEQEQRILYTNVLEYEQDHVSLTKLWKMPLRVISTQTNLFFLSLGLAQTVESQHEEES